MIPLICDLAGKRVVIVGGGTVALRKAQHFASEADVTVHAPAVRAGFADLPCELVRERVDADRARELLDDAFLAVVATDDSGLNARLTAVARERGCLVNRVDRSSEEGRPDVDADGDADATDDTGEGDGAAGSENATDRTTDERRSRRREATETGDVIVPSTIETDPITVAISTGGSSPAMAKYLRRRIEPVIEEAAPMVRLQRDLRAELKRAVEGSTDRRERLWAVVESEAVWDALDAGDTKRARRVARECAGLPPE